MIRSAAKNHKDVYVLVDPSQYQEFLNECKKEVSDESYKAKAKIGSTIENKAGTTNASKVSQFFKGTFYLKR